MPELRKSPFEQVRELYEKHPQPRSFWEDLDWFSLNGYVIVTPDFMVMGNKLRSDAWFIHAIAGDLAKAWDALPYDLPYIAFHRPRTPANDLRFYPLARLRALSKAHVLEPA
jgi:hypothetical protein